MSDAASASMINDPQPAELGEWKLPSHRKVGVITLIFTESALFTIFVVAYLFYIGKSLNGPFPKDVLEFPWVASFALFSSSVTVVIAEKAFHNLQYKKFQLFWGITILLGLLFIGYTALEWHHLIYEKDLTIATNVFGSTFYSLVGLHASHVIVGLILLSLVFGLSLTKALTPEQFERIEMISWYWHFVDAIWIVVLTVVYIISVHA